MVVNCSEQMCQYTKALLLNLNQMVIILHIGENWQTFKERMQFQTSLKVMQETLAL